MKRMLCALLALIWITCPAWAEITVLPSLPTPEAAPAGKAVSIDGVSLTLPAGFTTLDADALEGYAAAVESDYPGAAQILLAAQNAQREAYIALLSRESEVAAADAACEAAERILGDSDGVAEVQYGENPCAAMACAIEGRTYTLYFLSNGDRLLVCAVSALEAQEIAEMLAGLAF